MTFLSWKLLGDQINLHVGRFSCPLFPSDDSSSQFARYSSCWVQFCAYLPQISKHKKQHEKTSMLPIIFAIFLLKDCHKPNFTAVKRKWNGFYCSQFGRWMNCQYTIYFIFTALGIKGAATQKRQGFFFFLCIVPSSPVESQVIKEILETCHQHSSPLKAPKLHAPINITAAQKSHYGPGDHQASHF